MPKSRSRRVPNNFEFPLEYLNSLPRPEKVTVSERKPHSVAVNHLCFGDPVPTQGDISYRERYARAKSYNSPSSSEYDNFASGVSDLDIISFGKSSSSSVSWSEELDAEATQHVRKEFERMERVLQGNEPIPLHYNQDEYEQWIKTFPQLSITGNKMKYPVQHKRPNTALNDYDEEIIAFHSDINYLAGNCDREPTSTDVQKIEAIKKAVIEQVFQKICSKVLDIKTTSEADSVITVPKNQKYLSHKPEWSNLNDTQALAKQFDSFLRISPVLMQESTSRSFYLGTRQQSSHSVSRSDRLASKWMHEESVEYSSLPYLTSASAKNKSGKTVRHKNSPSSKSRYASKLSPSRNGYISLPPIKTLRRPLANQYRSTSATLQQRAKRSSAASVLVDSLQGRKKSPFEVVDYIINNNLKPRKNLPKYPK